MDANYEQSGATLSPAGQEHKQAGVTAMVLGIVSLVLIWYPVINIAGLILAIIGFSKAKTNRQFAAANGLKEENVNLAGYICGLIGIIGGAFMVLLYLLVIVLGVAIAGGVFNGLLSLTATTMA